MPMARSYFFFFVLRPSARRRFASLTTTYTFCATRSAWQTKRLSARFFPSRRPGGKGSKLSNLALQAILADAGFGQGCEDQDASWIGTRMSREQLGMCTYAYVLTAVNSVGGEA